METNSPSSTATKSRFITRLYRWIFSWRTARRAFIGFTIFSTLAVGFHVEENWRGKRVWKNLKRDLVAKGKLVDWRELVPQPVPDAQNVFKAPKMAEWFIRPIGASTRTELSQRLTNENTTAVITSREAAIAYLKWADQLAVDFEFIREGLRRPQVQIDWNYQDPFSMSRVDFITLRNVAQVLAQKARCHLLLDQPDAALQSLTLMNDSRRLLDSRPLTLVAVMINAAISGLYLEVVADGLNGEKWTKRECAALQSQISQVHQLALLPEAIRTELSGNIQMFETVTETDSVNPICENWLRLDKFSEALIPRGWGYLNLATLAKFQVRAMYSFAGGNQLINPTVQDELARDIENAGLHPWPDKYLAAIAVPIYSRACRTVARIQTKASQALVVIALQSFHVAHGEYPRTLAALVPQFIEKLPSDLIGSEPLKYQRTEDGRFLLYSIGWNKKDDDGKVSRDNDGKVNPYAPDGDWVWATENL